MSVEADGPREALFVFCLVSCRLVSPLQAIKEWIPDEEADLDWFNRPRNPHEPDPDWFDQTPKWKAPEIQMDDGRILVLE
jgi:hypothetical protein